MDLADLTQLLEGLDAAKIDCTSPEFLEAAETAKTIRGLSNETQLQLYGLFKQATLGDAATSGQKKPWAIDMVGSAKWAAWRDFEGFPREAAARGYVYVVQTMLPRPQGSGSGSSSSSSSSGGGGGSSGSSSSGSGGGGEPAGAGSIFDGMGVTTSTQAASDQAAFQLQGAGCCEWRDGEELFRAVVEGDAEVVRALLAAPACQVNARSTGLMTPLHFAVDRGNAEVVALLLAHGADAGLVDAEGQPPMTLAAICEYVTLTLTLSLNLSVTLTSSEVDWPDHPYSYLKP